MKSGTIGWLKKLLDEIQPVTNSTEHSDEQVYHLADPLLLLGESYIDISKDEFRHNSKIYSAYALMKIYREAVGSSYDPLTCSNKINDFLKILYPDLASSTFGKWGRKVDGYVDTEKFLMKRSRLFLIPDKNDFWWIFYNNTQAFLDFYLFRLFCISGNDAVISNYLRDQKDHLNFCMLKVIAAAAHADGEVVGEERELFQVFVKHNFLSTGRKKEATAFLNGGAGIEQLELEDIESWALKKFFLELAIATVWSDGLLDDKEESFIQNLLKVLALQNKDKVFSYVRIESFLLAIEGRGGNNQIETIFLNRIKALLSSYGFEIIDLLKSDSNLFAMLKSATTGSINESQQSDLALLIINSLKQMSVFRGINFSRLDWPYKNVIKILPKEVIRTLVS